MIFEISFKKFFLCKQFENPVLPHHILIGNITETCNFVY